MKRRPRRSTPATITALVLLAACGVVASVAIQMIAGQRPWLSYDRAAELLNRTHWNSLAVAIGGGVAALLGLILLLTAFLPGKATVLPLTGLFDSGASRRSLRSTLRAAASTVEGVSGTTLKVSDRKVSAVVRTDRTNTEGLADAVRGAIEQRLDQIGPARRPKIGVRINAVRSQ